MPMNHPRLLAREMRDSKFYHGTRAVSLVVLEVLCYLFALLYVVIAVLYIGMTIRVTALVVGDRAVVGEDIGTYMMVMQVVLLLAAVALFLLGLMFGRLRRQKRMLRRLCDAVLALE